MRFRRGSHHPTNTDRLADLGQSFLEHQRHVERHRARRWYAVAIFVALYVFGTLSVAFYQHYAQAGAQHVALVKVHGVIGGRVDTAREVNRALEKAFSARNSVGVIVSINTPGGSPVQSAVIRERLRALSARHGKRVIVVAEDLMASGGYSIALGGDKIYANPSSLIGSVGVILSSYGVESLAAKLGVERRVFASGALKNFLDPFAPVSPEQELKIDELVSDLYHEFAQDVIAARGAALGPNPEALFTGEVWSGRRALDLGLIDGLGTTYSVAADEFSQGRLVTYSGQTWAQSLLSATFTPSWLESIFSPQLQAF